MCKSLYFNSITEANPMILFWLLLQVTVAAIPATLVRLVAKSKLAQNYDLQSLRFIMSTGSKHSESIMKALQKNLPKTFIYEIYGTVSFDV